jgi:Dodecin
VTGTSTQSREDAAATAVKTAGETLRDLKVLAGPRPPVDSVNARARRLLRPVRVLDDVRDAGALVAGDESLQDVVSASGAMRSVNALGPAGLQEAVGFAGAVHLEASAVAMELLVQAEVVEDRCDVEQFGLKLSPWFRPCELPNQRTRREWAD